MPRIGGMHVPMYPLEGILVIFNIHNMRMGDSLGIFKISDSTGTWQHWATDLPKRPFSLLSLSVR